MAKYILCLAWYFSCVSLLQCKDALNFEQFSNCSILISTASRQGYVYTINNSLEVEIYNGIFKNNLPHHPVLQLGVSPPNLLLKHASPCRVVILVAVGIPSFSVSFEVEQSLFEIENGLKYQLAICIVQPEVDIVFQILPMQRKTNRIFLLKVSESQGLTTGVYSYLCFLCGSPNKFVESPSWSISDLNFQYDWKRFQILVNSVNPETDYNLTRFCNDRPLKAVNLLCK